MYNIEKLLINVGNDSTHHVHVVHLYAVVVVVYAVVVAAAPP